MLLMGLYWAKAGAKRVAPRVSMTAQNLRMYCGLPEFDVVLVTAMYIEDLTYR
jgi:hypothetical protein